MKRRLTALLMTLILLLGVIPASAAETASGTYSGCRWSFDGTVLTLSPLEYGGGHVNGGGGFDTPWWDGDFEDQIRIVIVEEGIRSLDGGLFEYSDYISDIYLPASLESIGYGVFGYYEVEGLTVHYAGSPFQWETVSEPVGEYGWLKGVPVEFYSSWNNEKEVPDSAILQNFSAGVPYTPGQFTDVKASDWFAPNVQRACEFGLMNGMGDGSFHPQGNLTVAQVVTIAARLHSTYYDTGYQFTQTSPWYKTYTDYAVSHGLVQADTDFNAVCTRALFASILYGAVEAREFNVINDVPRIPDIHKIDWYAPAVYGLYYAGVLQGNNAYGTFGPYTSITRAETAAILSRIVDKDQRVQFTLTTPYFTLANPMAQRVFYGPNGQKLYVTHANKVSPTGDWGFYTDTYQGDFSGMPKITASWSSMTFQYGSEKDTYNAYFYVKGSSQIVVVLVNTLTGEQSAWYMYNLWNGFGDCVGMCLINVFDKTDQRYMYDTYYWDSGNYGFTQMTAASAYDE